MDGCVVTGGATQEGTWLGTEAARAAATKRTEEYRMMGRTDRVGGWAQPPTSKEILAWRWPACPPVSQSVRIPDSAPRMRSTVRCFAAVREALATETMELLVPQGPSVETLRQKLGKKAPPLLRVPVAFAVNRDYARG